MYMIFIGDHVLRALETGGTPRGMRRVRVSLYTLNEVAVLPAKNSAKTLNANILTAHFKKELTNPPRYANMYQMIPGPHKNYTPSKYQSPQADNIEYGPAMKALNPRQQALVLYLLDTGTDNWTEAVTEVGYEGNNATLRVTASRLRRDPKIGMAIAEVGRQRPNFDLPMALRTIRTIAADTSHKDAGKMALALAGMSGVSPVARSEAAVTVTHHLDPMDAIRAKLALLPPDVAANLAKQLLPPEMIDVTPSPVLLPERVPDSDDVTDGHSGHSSDPMDVLLGSDPDNDDVIDLAALLS